MKKSRDTDFEIRRIGIFFAMFGLFPWDAVPQLPVEFMLIPKQFPINIYRLSSWARSTLIPLLIIRHHQPIYKLPNGRSASNNFLDELWVDPENKMVPYTRPMLNMIKDDLFGLVFTLIDKVLYGLGLFPFWPLRGYSRRLAMNWILERQEKEGDWVSIRF